MKRFTPAQNELTQNTLKLTRAGKIKYALVLWLMGAPMILVFLALFARGCDF